jgi:hypothetical protein
MDEAIINDVKREHKLLIGQQTAEEIKLEVGSAHPLNEEVQAEVRGRDMLTGLPKTVILSSEEVRHAFEKPIAQRERTRLRYGRFLRGRRIDFREVEADARNGDRHARPCPALHARPRGTRGREGRAPQDARRTLAVRHGYRVGRPFGSNEHKGQDFGSHVPALITYARPGEPPTDVHPREDLDGRIVTIAEYLTSLDSWRRRYR